MGPTDPPRPNRWPELRTEAWVDTRDTLQLWTQVVGKVRMENEPVRNHWWNVPLYLTSRGFTTSLIPHQTGPEFQVDFDLVDHRLEISTILGTSRTLPLEPRTVADFYAAVMAMLAELGVATTIWPVPVEIPDSIPFEDDTVHHAYDPDHAHRFWRALVETARAMNVFRGDFVGKSSPVHLFWGALDLATTRFSGRGAPPHPGGAPNCGPHVMHEAYSHEVSSCGYWPGGPAEEGVFYAYAYPEPDGYRTRTVAPDAAWFDEALAEFVLPYEAVRTAKDPDALLLEFFRSTYVAAAESASWDRAALERPETPPA